MTKPEPNRQQLDRAAWVKAALDILAEKGLDGIRIEVIAKRLRVTKGSFYWHFADRRALLDAVLDTWAQGRIAAIRQQVATGREPEATLRHLAELYTRRANLRGLSIELAIRALARTDAAAARAVRAVDLERLKLVGTLFAGLGWPATDAQARAILFYSFLFGESLLDARTVTAPARDNAVRALIAPPA